MNTILDEILMQNEYAVAYSNNHLQNCSCKKCKSSAPGKYKPWRQRKTERPYKRCAANSITVITDKEQNEDQFLGAVFGNLNGNKIPINNTAPASKLSSLPVSAGAANSPVISIGEKQRSILLKQWIEKRNRAKSPVVKQRYQDYIDVILKRKRPSWHQSEKDIQLFFKKSGMPGQRTYLKGQPAKWIQTASGRRVPPGGSVVPDINPADTMIEVKNYNINNRDALIRILQKQINRRMLQGPKDATGQPLPQRVILDMRGQKATLNQLRQLVQNVANKTGLPRQNVQAVTWEIQ